MRDPLEGHPGATFAVPRGVTRDSGGEGPTLEEIFSQIRERWEDIGRLIADVQRGLAEVQSIRHRIDDLETRQSRRGIEAAPDLGAAETA
jgi:hypothetical protein